MEYHNGTESGDNFGEDSTLPPLVSETKMDEMSLGNKSDAETMSTDMLEDVCDGRQSHTKIYMR